MHKKLGIAAVVVVLLGVAQVLQALTYRELLNEYTGSWQGEYTVSSFNGQYVKSLSAEMQYWWEDDVQHALTVYDENGKITYSQSTIFVEHGNLYADVTTGDEEPKRFIGRVRGRTITWIPTNVLEAIGNQMNETVEYQRDKKCLIVQGMHTIGTEGQDTVLNIRGKFDLYE